MDRTPECEALVVEMRHVVEDMKDLRNDLRDLRTKQELSEKAALILFVSKEQFQPIKNIVYGMVAIVLSSVVGAILTLVLRMK